MNYSFCRIKLFWASQIFRKQKIKRVELNVGKARLLLLLLLYEMLKNFFRVMYKWPLLSFIPFQMTLLSKIIRISLYFVHSMQFQKFICYSLLKFLKSEIKYFVFLIIPICEFIINYSTHFAPTFSITSKRI